MKKFYSQAPAFMPGFFDSGTGKLICVRFAA